MMVAQPVGAATTTLRHALLLAAAPRASLGLCTPTKPHPPPTPFAAEIAPLLSPLSRTLSAAGVSVERP